MPNALLDVSFPSASKGFALSADRLLSTSDGGRSWRVLRAAAGARWTSIDFVNASDGWLLGAGGLLSTTDGGAHWRRLAGPCEEMRSVDFVSAEEGFAIAGGGEAAPLGALWGRGETSVLHSSNGGRTWSRLPAPGHAQSLCFLNDEVGFLGADGNVYATEDGGERWTLSLEGQSGRSARPLAVVGCARGGAWAEIVGPGGEASQEPHIAYAYEHGSWQPVFAEQYFPHPSVDVTRGSPGSEPASFSAISAEAAVFIDFCPACSPPSAPIAIAGDGGRTLARLGNIPSMSEVTSASFRSEREGWVAGALFEGGGHVEFLLLHTDDRGRTWQTQYTVGQQH